jgi:DNA repair protein RecN (Recombination protein N)
MLRELKIKDFAIIDTLTIDFTDGMGIFTGETGAGKSIIVDAVNLILGTRGSVDYVRSGCREAKIEALFDIAENSVMQKTLGDLDYEHSSELVIKRVLSSAGKSKVTINDSLSTLNVLNKISPLLINVYGQNEHQELLNKEKHLEILDSFGGLSHLLNEYKKSFLSLKEVEDKLEELIRAAENRDKETGFIKYQLSEILAADLRDGEEEELKKEREMLINAEKILDACSFGFENIYSKDGSVNTCLSEILSRIDKIKELDNSFENYHNEIKNALYVLEDAAFFFRDYPKKVDFSLSSLDEIESRLEAINGIKKKYGAAFEDVIKTKEELEKKLTELENITENCGLLEKKQAKLLTKTMELAKKLSDKRHKSEKRLSDKMINELKSLGIPNAKFIAKFQKQAELNLNETGKDEVEFYFSANPGENFKPLLKIASGGELSRIMLALKNVTKSEDAPATLIFDEVDSGIGGKTAHIVGAKLKGLSHNNQVICVTHLPQIASYADSHYYVTKEQKGGRTVTKVAKLGHDERVREVARLLSGETVTGHSIKHAADMIAKNSMRGIN